MSKVMVQSAGLTDALLITYPIHVDQRGFFVRVLDRDLLAENAGIDASLFVQESQSRSIRGTLRGLHSRCSLSESKLVRCSAGAIYDVIVDLRPWSPTYRTWKSFVLDDVDHAQLYIPAGFAHGFQALSEIADVQYRMDAPYAPDLDRAIRFNDPDLGVDWPLAAEGLSARDSGAPFFREIEADLASWFGGRRA
jgi:dTDP-4-dehydrorhamnose 3,5-epimerase